MSNSETTPWPFDDDRPTPRPWRVGSYHAVRGLTATIEAGEGPTFVHIATVSSRADAELIVKAVNDAGENPIQQAIDANVAAERERCAKIVVDVLTESGWLGRLF